MELTVKSGSQLHPINIGCNVGPLRNPGGTTRLVAGCSPASLLIALWHGHMRSKFTSRYLWSAEVALLPDHFLARKCGRLLICILLHIQICDQQFCVSAFVYPKLNSLQQECRYLVVTSVY